MFSPVRVRDLTFLQNVYDSEDAAIHEHFASTIKFIDEAREQNKKGAHCRRHCGYSVNKH